MSNTLKWSAIAASFIAVSGVAYGQNIGPRGGFAVSSSDGEYSAQLGGRIHLDTNVFVDDDDVDSIPTNLFFRRARLTLEGKAGAWHYKFENDFVVSDQEGFREMWIGTKLAGFNLRLGQAKPYRALEELVSSNEVLFMERPFATASALYDGRQYQIGAFLDGSGSHYGWGTALYSLRNAGDEAATDGFGLNARVYVAPIVGDMKNAHLGLSYSADNPDRTNANNNAQVRARVAGREGAPRPVFAAIGADTASSLISTIGLEAAFQTGPIYLQAEYAIATLEQDVTPDIDIDTFYAQASYLLGGANRRYDLKKGVFKSPSVTNAGVTELKARIDRIESDVNQGPELTQFAVGANHYFNGNVRLMAEYVMGELDNLTPGTDVDVGMISTRLQFSF